MASTIYCSFAREDFANFAAGRLTQEVAGVLSIRRVRAKNNTRNTPPPTGITLASWGTAESLAVSSVSDDTAASPEEPVTLKIICDTASRNRVTSLLRGMQGYHILPSD